MGNLGTSLRILEIERMINWINQKDVFWLEEFKVEFGVTDGTKSTKKSDNFGLCTRLIHSLKRDNYLQCCNINGSKRQYMVIRTCSVSDFRFKA